MKSFPRSTRGYPPNNEATFTRNREFHCPIGNRGGCQIQDFLWVPVADMDERKGGRDDEPTRLPQG